MSQRIKAKSQYGLTLGDFKGWFELSFSFQIKYPNDTRSIISKVTTKMYDPVAKVLPSLAKAIQLIGSLAMLQTMSLPALVGLVMTYPFYALQTTRISEMATKSNVPSGLNVQLQITLEFGGQGLGCIKEKVQFVRTTFRLDSLRI